MPIEQNSTVNGKKILLALLPFWTPLNPPLGIASLKTFLQDKGYHVKAVDANVDVESKKIYNQYIETLNRCVPKNKRGKSYDIVHDVLRNQMMAHINSRDKREYLELLEVLLYKYFYVHFNNSQVLELTEILDEFYSGLEKYLINLLDKECPTLFGLSVFSSTLPASVFAFKLVREKYPHIKTVMGGGIFDDQLAVGTSNLKFFLEKTKDYIDRIIIGEGESLFLKLLRGDLPESQRVYTLDDIHQEVLELSSVNIQDFTDFNLREYPYMSAFISRGCPYQCAFCSETVRWGKYRRKTISQAVEELIKLNENHNSRLFLMTDSLLNPVITDLSRELIKSGVSFYLDGYIRVDRNVCDMQNTLLWRRGGLYRARLGVESGSQYILDSMNKKIIPGQIKEAVSSLASAGIKTSTLWIVGYPGETEEDFQQTLALIEELKDDIYEIRSNPFSYHLEGQVSSNIWAENYKSTSLFPQEAEMLMTQTWILECEPSREEVYNRLNRFTAHCNGLNIPDPYSLQEICQADQRWKSLHKNAVPSFLQLLEFKNNGIEFVDEYKNGKEFNFARDVSRLIYECEF